MSTYVWRKLSLFGNRNWMGVYLTNKDIQYHVAVIQAFNKTNFWPKSCATRKETNALN